MLIRAVHNTVHTMKTTAQLKALTRAGMYKVADTLYLRIAPGGSKQWVQRLTIHGKRHHMGLGPFPAIPVKIAKRAAINNRSAVYQGHDPVAERREAKRTAAIPTFENAVAMTFDAIRARWTSEHSARQWTSLLSKNARPLMQKRVDTITQTDVLNCLLPVYKKTPDAGRRTRQNIRTVLGQCEARGLINRNVAGEAIDAALPKKQRTVHLAAMPHKAAPATFAKLADHTNRAAALLVRFLILTAARSGEARGATWGEIDMDAATWTIPGNRMKTRCEHRIPLTDSMLALLRQARDLSDGSGLVFPSPSRTGGIVDAKSLVKTIRNVSGLPKITIHGLRTTFVEWCSETGKPEDVADASLAHAKKGVKAHYFRSDMFDRRRDLMARWSAFVADTRGTVTQIRAA